MRKHYHVGNGSPGCMFDNDCETFTNKRDAQKYMLKQARETADLYRDETGGGVDIVGTARSGIIQIQYGLSGAYNYELYSCDDALCLNEEW